jgi:hypothetical protein
MSQEAIATAPIDCNDMDMAVRPGASEIVGDDRDQDCNGSETCYIDGDGDGARAMTGTVMSANISCGDPGEARSTASIDCCDGDARAFPGQTSYFTTVSSCSNYDFDCSGSATRQYTTTGATSFACHGSPPWCIADNLGWTGASIPACGTSANYNDCNTTNCSTLVHSVTQGCR